MTLVCAENEEHTSFWKELLTYQNDVLSDINSAY